MTTPFIISLSDARNFHGCRNRWDMASRNRMGWRPQTSLPHFDFGHAWHAAMATYYSPKVFEEWTLQGRQRLARLAFDNAVNAQHRRALAYWWDLDDDQEAEFRERSELGAAMLEHYFEWAAANDNFDPIGVETEFTVDLEMTTHDGRPVLFLMRVDGLVRDRDYGQLWLLEHKTASKPARTTYLAMDEQLAMYSWALQQRGINLDVRGVIWTQAMKIAPAEPRLLKNGSLSVDRSQYTTSQRFLDALIGLYGPRMEENEQFQAKRDAYVSYLNYLISDEHQQRFVQRERVPVSADLMAGIGHRIRTYALEMSDNPLIYPHVTPMCNNCQYFSPCLLRQEGQDWRFALESDYVPYSKQPDSDEEWIATNQAELAKHRKDLTG